MIAGQRPEPRRDRVESLVPADPLPARIGGSLGARALERMQQPLGVVHDLGRRLALDAERLAGRVRRVRVQRENSPSLTVAVAPQRDTHKGQKVETCFVAMRSPTGDARRARSSRGASVW